MTAPTLEISRIRLELRPGVTYTLEESLERFCRQTWPRCTPATISLEWGLTADEAREVIRGRASRNVINKIAQHPRGGWGVLIPVLIPVIGVSLQEWIAGERERLLDQLAEVNSLDLPDLHDGSTL